MRNRKPFLNDFSLSFSTYRLFSRCARAWWISKVLFWRGWEVNAPPGSRLAYRLTKMQTVYTLAGSIVHAVAADVLAGRGPATAAAAYDVLASRMAYGWRQSQEEDWARDPKRAVNLFEHYYRHPDALRLRWSAEGRARAALAGLYESEALARARRGQVVSTELLERVDIAGVPVWVILDAVVKADELFYLVDWKAGRASPDHATQALLYAAFFSRTRRRPLDQIRVALAYLGQGEETLLAPGVDQIRAVELAVVQAAETIRARLKVPSINDGPEDLFPATTDVQTCRSCRLYHACKGTRQIAGGPSVGSSTGGA